MLTIDVSRWGGALTRRRGEQRDEWSGADKNSAAQQTRYEDDDPSVRIAYALSAILARFL